MQILKRLLLLLCILLSAIITYSQNRSIKGKITDAITGKPIPGATITLKGGASSSSTVTNNAGEFTLHINPSGKPVLVITSVGYISREVEPGDDSSIDIELEQDAKTQDEIVVVAYGTQKRSSLTSAISTVNAKKLTDVPTANVSNTIGGRAAGVLFKQQSGEPGYDDATIRIRGVGTIGNANALVIIDGVERPLNSIDPHDIQSFSVLKDAASVAPYGVRGANGIILITTKRGTGSGKFSLTYDGKTGWTRPAVLPKPLNSFEWATLKNEGARNQGVAEPYNEEALQKFKDGSDPDFYANSNAIDLLLKTGRLQQHNLSVTGGNENISFYGSLGYVDQTAMWGKATRFKRYTVRSNIDARLTPTTKIGLDFTGVFRDGTFPGAAGGPGFILFGLYRLNPTNPIFYSDGKPAGYFERNPYLDINGSGYFKENHYTQMITLKLEQKIPFVPGLVLRGNIAVDKYDESDKQWRTPYTFYQINPDRTFISAKGNVPKPSLTESYEFRRRINSQLMVAYNKSFGAHGVDLLGVFEPRIDRQNLIAASRANYELLIDELSNSGNSNPADRSNGGGSSKITQVGYVYKAGYNYGGKYMFEAAGRYDGQSYFSPYLSQGKYAFFPSFSAAWRVSEENFMKGFTAIDNLKIRGSWGKSGNLADQSFQYLRLYQLGSAYLFNNVANASVYEVREPSLQITWEKAIKTDIGFELSMWGGLLSIEADYFKEKRNDMLLASTAILPVEYGIGIGQENTGRMENQGFDFRVASNYTVNKNLALYGAFNFTYAKNKIVNINESESIKNNPNRTQIGKPWGTDFMYEALGLFQNEDEISKTAYAAALGTVKPGDIKYNDLNNDGKLNTDDLKAIGNPLFPKIIYGFEGGLSYKNFQLDMLWQGAAGVSFYLAGWASQPFNQGNGVAFQHQLDVWRPDNTDAALPRIVANPDSYPYNYYRSSFWQRNGDYVRLKSLSLGYTFNKIVKGIHSVKLYAAGQNLLTFAKLDYWDPETPSTTEFYYNEKAISVGVTINF